MQLFCIPYAGGKAAVFEQLQPYLKEDITLCPLEYAGHGTRINEPFYPSFDAMAQDIAEQINAAAAGESIAIFGYSMGSVVAFELLLNQYLHTPVEHLFIASHEAPGEHWSSMDYAALDDEAFFEKLIEFGSFQAGDEKRLTNRFFRKMIFNSIRADYRLIASYRLTNDRQLDLPVTMMYSPLDVPTEAAEKWQNRFVKPIRYITVGSNHFFIYEQPQTVADIMNQTL